MNDKEYAFDRVKTMIAEGMYQGNMHKCLRDAGRLAGGFAANGLLSSGDLDQLRSEAVSRSLDKSKGEAGWEEGIGFGKKQPLSIETRDRSKPLSWDSEIGPGFTVKETPGVDYVEPVPEDHKTPIKDLVTYLSALYQPDDIVSYVTKAFEDGEGKYKPGGRGQYTRTAGEIIQALEKHQDLESALESYNHEAGAWGRLNPLTGAGVRNDDVVDHRYVLIESDDIAVEQQLSTIRQIGLPCVALVHSGGKSIHAVVKVDAGSDKTLYRERVEYLFDLLDKLSFRVDRQNRNPSRLSRWPGFERGESTQYLISVNEGAADWAAFETSQKANKYKYERWDPAYIMEPHEDDSLAGDRFLVKHGSWMIVAQSGVGKSVLAMQIAACFCTGRDFFDISPIEPLRIVLIQAENNVIDLQEPMASMKRIFTKKENDLLQKNLVVLTVSRYAGEAFCDFLRYVITAEKPQIVIMDPLLAYSRGDISKMENCNEFLRHQLDPILKEHDVGLIAMHHTGKPPKNQESKLQGGDLSYLGIGSSDLTNWARAISVVTEADEGRFLFTHPKRGGKLERMKTYLRRGVDGDVRWHEADSQMDPEPVKKKQGKFDGLGFEFLSGYSREKLEEKIEHHFPGEKTQKLIVALEKKGFLSYNYQNRVFNGRAAGQWEESEAGDLPKVEKEEEDTLLPF